MAFTAPNYQEYYTSANTKLAEYYARLLMEEQGDINRAMARLTEDYTRGNRINLEDYERNVAFGRESYTAGLAEEAQTKAGEERALKQNLLSRGVSQGGLAQTQESRLAERQQLRREAIDRALRKSEEDLRYAKERGMEQETITQRRGTEDLATQWAKFQTDKAQEREEKALGLAEQSYQREFAKRSTEESFRLQEASLAKMP